MRLRLLRWVSCLTAILLVATTLQAGVSLGQIDTFTDGTTMNWTNGDTGFGIVTVNHDGPAGATDSFMQVASGAYGGSEKLITFNLTQWTGDFTGVAGIRVDLKNLDPRIANPMLGTAVARPIRFAIREFHGSSGTPGYSSSAYTVPADPNWHQSVFFPFTTLSMTAINSPGPLATEMAAVGEFRLLSAVNPALTGDAIDAVIGADNITAVPKGDWNQDASLTTADVQAMLNALTDLNVYKQQKNLDNIGLLALGDFNFDGAVNNSDIQPLLNYLSAHGGGSIAAVPEPSAVLLGLTAMAIFGMWRRPMAPLA
jgi:hypothetical protein